MLRFEDPHLPNQVVIWHSKAPKCWLQILSKWAVISHSDRGEASKLQHFRGALFEDLHLPNQVVIWQSKAPKCWPQILSKWAVISHSDRGEASKLQHFRGALFEDLHLPNQVVIWQSKAPKCWPQILSKWAVISHSDWGEASKLQHFKCSVLKTCMCFIKLWYDIWQSKAPKWWFQILSKWAVINHSDWGEASKRHQNCNTPEVLFLKTCICLIKLRYDTPKPKMLTPDSL